MPPTSRNPAWLAAREIFSSSTANIACAKPKADEIGTGAPLFGNSGINLHQFMVYVSAGCLGITLISCVFLSWRHLHRYTSSQEQRQILRIANLPFFYSLFNFLALLFTIDYLFIEPLSGIYESFALAALFLLVLEFVVPDGTDREQYFDRLELRDKKGVKPGGSLKWFQRTWSSVLAYPVLKTVLITVQIVTQYFGVYCENSFSPQHAHLYLTIIDYLFVGGALGAVIRFYMRLKKEIPAVHKARAKIFSFLGILVFQIIQDLIFHILNGKLFSPTKTATYNDINFGIASFMTCIEAVIFSLIFHWAYSAGEYKEGEKQDRLGTGAAKRTKTSRAILDALNLSDIVAGSVLAFQLLFMRVQSRYGASKNSAAPEQSYPLATGGGRNFRGYDNVASHDEEHETYYHQGYNPPPFPAAARDPSPGASYGRAQLYGDSYVESQPLHQPRDMIQ